MSNLSVVPVSAMLHVRYDGQSTKLSLSTLDIGPLSSDEQVLVQTARAINAPLEALRGYVVVREDNGNITVRPEAPFG